VPTEKLPCELGVDVNDKEEGPLTVFALVCPPASCLSLGCPKHVAFNPDGTLNKPLQPFCINTASPIGTEISIDFVVFEQNTYPPKMSKVTRTVNIVAPCDVGYELCPQDNVCSNIDCAQRELLTSQVSVTDTAPPTLRTAVPAVVEVPYKQTTAYKYTVCAKCGDAG